MEAMTAALQLGAEVEALVERLPVEVEDALLPPDLTAKPLSVQHHPNHRLISNNRLNPQVRRHTTQMTPTQPSLSFSVEPTAAILLDHRHPLPVPVVQALAAAHPAEVEALPSAAVEIQPLCPPGLRPICTSMRLHSHSQV